MKVKCYVLGNKKWNYWSANEQSIGKKVLLNVWEKKKKQNPKELLNVWANKKQKNSRVGMDGHQLEIGTGKQKAKGLLNIWAKRKKKKPKETKQSKPKPHGTKIKPQTSKTKNQ